MKKILITGASGYLGARLFFDLRNYYNVVGTYFGSNLYDKFIKLDTTDAEEVKKVVIKEHPDIIIHTAALASSKLCEDNPDKCKRINVEGTRYVANAAKEAGAKVIFISSTAAFNPNKMYGKTKVEGEKIIKSNLDDYLIIRPSVILGCSPNTKPNNLFNEILSSLDKHEESKQSITREYQPTYIGHISEVINLGIRRDINKETILVASNEIKTRFDIANDILSNFDVSVHSIKDWEGPTGPQSTDKLRELNLPMYSYREIIKKIVDEINHREQITL